MFDQQEYFNSIAGIRPVLEFKKKHEDFYNSIDDETDRQAFIDFIEYSFMPRIKRQAEEMPKLGAWAGDGLDSWRYLEGWVKTKRNASSIPPVAITEDVAIPEKTIEKVRMLILLGVIDLIRNNDPNKGANANQLSEVFAKILDVKRTSIHQPIFYAYMKGDLTSKHHPFYSEHKKKQTIEKIQQVGLQPFSS
jgi:hypothetical protein